MSANSPEKLILNHLTTACLLLDKQLTVAYANPAAESLLSSSVAQLQGTAFANYLPNDNAEQELNNALASDSPYTHRESLLHIPGNGTITVDFTATPMPNGLLLVELNHIDRILHINREEALRSVQTTSQELVRGMAHEVKNPLGGIKGAAQLLALELSDEQREFTDVIITETSRLSNLVDQLLGPARPLRIEALNIHQITEHVATLIESEAPQLTILREYDPSIPDIPADRDQLIQAALNVARNAMQALTEADDVEQPQIVLRTAIQRHFTIGSSHHKMVCRIDIIDNGPGIDPEVVDRIFYPMISGRANGSGLGLPISQTIISRHQGLIKCSSEPGHTTFSIFLPLTQHTATGTDT